MTGIHRSRFNETGVGLGLLGSRDDTLTASLNAGKGVILRDAELPTNSPYITPEQRAILQKNEFVVRIT